MRISDWSSDVCSSDLAAPARGAASRSSLAGLGERGKNGSGIVGRDVADLGELGIELRDHVAHDAGLGRVVKHVDELERIGLAVEPLPFRRLVAGARAPIGRASCRGRVVTYV